MTEENDMKIYTKTGDGGTTSLMKTRNVQKSDDRIQLLGTIDELTSNLGLVKASGTDVEMSQQIERIQKNLMMVMSGIADQYNKDYRLDEAEVAVLETEINRMEGLFPREKKFVLPGENRLSAQIDVARTVARRAERWMSAVDRKFSVDKTAKKYMNRLSDYLYIAACYTGYVGDREGDVSNHQAQAGKGAERMTDNEVIKAVLEKLGRGISRISLETAKKLIEKVEAESARIGLNAVIAVCGPDGNPIAVHAMDDSFLASFDIAMKKAYTSVAVRMPTSELAKMAQPGQPLYGIDKADNGKIIIFGGGVPLAADGRIIGGLGVSGGTTEQDTGMAEFGLAVFPSVI